MKIAIVAPFGGFNSSYSLCSIVLDQADGLGRLGHEVEIWALTNCVAEVPTRNAAQIRLVIPTHKMHTGEIDHEKLHQVRIAIGDRLDSFRPDAIVTHDVIFQRGYMTVNDALRQERSIRTSAPAVHVLHSATGDEKRWGRGGVLRHDRIVYGDRTRLGLIARNYGVERHRVHHLHMPRDISLAQYHSDDVTALIRRHRLHERDAVAVFPASQPRLKAKGIQIAADVMRAVRDLGKSVALVVCDAHASDDRAGEFMDARLGDDMIFTSRAGVDRWISGGLNPRELTDLRSVANLFVWPSTAEMSPLAVREAMLAGHLLVLNGSSPNLHELAGENAIYAAWPETRVIGGSASEAEVARRIVARLDGCPINRARRAAMRDFSAEQHARELLDVIQETQ